MVPVVPGCIAQEITFTPRPFPLLPTRTAQRWCLLSWTGMRKERSSGTVGVVDCGLCVVDCGLLDLGCVLLGGVHR